MAIKIDVTLSDTVGIPANLAYWKALALPCPDLHLSFLFGVKPLSRI